MAHHKSSDPNVFILPDLGEGVHEAELLKWRVEVGQTVNEHDILADMETDKAVVEVPSPRAGTIAQLHGNEGEILNVGNPLVTYVGGAGAAAPAGGAGRVSVTNAAATAGNNGSHAGSSSDTGEIEIGERTEDAGTVVGQMSGAAAGVSAAPGKALATPAVRRLARDLGVDINAVIGSGIGGRVLEKDVRAGVGGGKKAAGKTAPSAAPAGRGGGCDMGEPSIPPAPIKAVPPTAKSGAGKAAAASTTPGAVARAAAASRGDVRVPMASSRPTAAPGGYPPAPAPGYAPGYGQGYPQQYAMPYPPMYPPAYGMGYPGGYPMPPAYGYAYPPPMPYGYPGAVPMGYGQVPGAAAGGVPHAPGYVPASAGSGVPDPAQKSASAPGTDARVPFRGVRRTIANRLRESVNSAVHFTVVDEADVTSLDDLRRQLAAETGEKISFLPFLCAAVCRVIGPGRGGRFGALNARVNDAAEEIVQHGSVHLGIATDTDAGLMVPVVKDADLLDVLGLGREIARVAAAARDRTAPRDMLMGSTFTISNVGSHAGRFATPVINAPEVGIIAVGRVRDAVVVREGQAFIGKVMPLSLACDHRVVDGATAALALAEIVQLLQEPESLLA
jgi:pyruvate dehydrogenase E2 component (dihydrolipoamide acetyltransferase)